VGDYPMFFDALALLLPHPSEDKNKIFSTTLGGSIISFLSPVKTAEILLGSMVTLTLNRGGGSLFNVERGSVYTVA